MTQIKSYEADLHRNELQNIFDLNDFTRDTVALYWKAKAISVSVRENRDLFNKYESLIKTIQKKKNNNYATAGELEQALAEFEVRKQSWKEDENTLNNYLSQLKSFLNLPPESEIQITLENSPQSLPEKNSITIENLKKYQLQKLKTDSARLNAEASEFKGYPRLSLYSRYLQQGLDNQSSSRAWTDLRDDATNKYAIGLKLDYTFDDQASTKDRQYKQITAQIETDRLNRFKEDLSLQVKNSREKLENSYQNIQSTQTILKYRIEAVKQIAVNYSQGRTDISFLIDAYNKKITAEVNAVNAYGQYVQNLMDYQSLVL